MSADRIILWRHGRTAYNHSGRWQGQLDIELDATGVSQAAQAAAQIADYHPTAIISSDLCRARVTAQALGDQTGIKVRIDPRLREIDVGQWQGLSQEEVIARWPDDYFTYRSGDPSGANVVVGGGESRVQVAARMMAAIQEAAAQVEGTIVIVSHGAAVRYATVGLLGLSDAEIPIFAGMGNANWHVLGLRDEASYRLVEYNVSAARGVKPVEVWDQVGARTAVDNTAGSAIVA